MTSSIHLSTFPQFVPWQSSRLSSSQFAILAVPSACPMTILSIWSPVYSPLGILATFFAYHPPSLSSCLFSPIVILPPHAHAAHGGRGRRRSGPLTGLSQGTDLQEIQRKPTTGRTRAAVLARKLDHPTWCSLKMLSEKYTTRFPTVFSKHDILIHGSLFTVCLTGGRHASPDRHDRKETIACPPKTTSTRRRGRSPRRRSRDLRTRNEAR